MRAPQDRSLSPFSAHLLAGGRKGHPLEEASPIVLFTEATCISRGRSCAASRSLHPGTPPIDNRWNKKLEFVYSLVTQIRAAARHPLQNLSSLYQLYHYYRQASPTSPTNTSGLLLLVVSSATTKHHRRIGRRVRLPTPVERSKEREREGESGAPLPKRWRRLHRQRG